METEGIGLYVHIPFCVSKCKYCDFASFSNIGCAEKEEYVKRLISEIESYGGKRKKLNSIFFGGGTPSLLTIPQMQDICKAIKDTFEISSDCEFTVEVNPKTIDRGKLDFYKSIGVNRISIGMQSIHENELKYLGRIHSFDEFLDCYSMVIDAGISNINVDIMYGIPHQTKESFIETLKRVVLLEPAHISVYGLIIEPGTPFYENRDSLPIPSEDDEVEMYYDACGLLATGGYNHYEISNYAKPGFECRHNLKYWENKSFIGVGLSAYSYIEKLRYGNTKNFNEYLTADYAKYRTEDKVDAESERFEYVMMHLRLSSGISLREFRERFSSCFLDDVGDALKKYIDNGYVACSDDRVWLTEKGFYLSNSIIADIV